MLGTLKQLKLQPFETLTPRTATVGSIASFVPLQLVVAVLMEQLDKAEEHLERVLDTLNQNHDVSTHPACF